jgi:hypothetical protein
MLSSTSLLVPIVLLCQKSLKIPKVECDIVIGKVQTIRWPKEHKYPNNVEKPYTERISSMKAH